MATLTGITAVRPTANTQLQKVVYGATVAPGQPVYLDNTDDEYKLADSNASEATAQARGIAITPGVDGGYGLIATGGSIILVGTTATVGNDYYVGATAGEIIDVGSMSSGDYVTRLGNAATATQLDLNIHITGNQIP